MSKKKDGADAIALYEEMTSRDAVLKMPAFMAILGYMARHHSIPRYYADYGRLQYHYTDAAGLISIIKTNRLWASHINFQNDPSEGSFFVDRMVELFEAKANLSSEPADRKLLSAIEAGLKNPRSPSSTFSISFCDNADLLSQWRGYGSFGKGYAIGFDLKARPHPQLGKNIKVLYGEQNFTRLSEDLWDIYRQAYKTWGSSIAAEAAAALLAVSQGFKNESFREEQESRILIAYSEKDSGPLRKSAPMEFRVRNEGILPYISLSLDILFDGEPEQKLPIRRIVTGPGVNSEQARVSIALLLEQNGFSDIPIEPSRIPFRA